jgi:hypothetical protein
MASNVSGARRRARRQRSRDSSSEEEIELATVETLQASSGTVSSTVILMSSPEEVKAEEFLRN